MDIENKDIENQDTPVTSVGFDAITSVKGDDGNNYFTDKHLEKLGLWSSDDPTKAKFKTTDGKIDVTKLTKSYLELEERLAKVSNPLPENATEAERFEHKKLVQKLGNVPATPDEYEFLVPEDLPDEIKVNKDDENDIKIMLHKHNASKELGQAVVSMLYKQKLRELDNYKKQLTAQNTEFEALMKAEMGPDDFVENGKLIMRMFRKNFAGDDEQFEAFYNNIKSTLFPGGSETKVTLNKVLAEAARVTEGAGSSIYTQHKEAMTEREAIKKKYPKSHSLLTD